MLIPLLDDIDARNEDSYDWAARNGSGILNGFAVVAGKKIKIEKRVGSGVVNTVDGPTFDTNDLMLGSINKLFSASNNYFAFFDSSASKAYLYKDSVSLGSLTTTTYASSQHTPVHITDCDGYIVANAYRTSEAYTYDGTTYAKITDAQFPATASAGGAFLNGRYFIGTTRASASKGTIVQSELDNPTSYLSTDTITAERNPDGVVLLFSHNDRVVAIGDQSIELFYDNANPTGTVLNRIPDLSFAIGMDGENHYRQTGSYSKLGNDVFFMGFPASQGNSYSPPVVYMMRGLSVVKISNDNIDKILAEYSAYSWIGHATNSFGRPLYFLTAVSESTVCEFTVVYDINNGLWYQWALNTYKAFPIIGSIESRLSFLKISSTATGITDIVRTSYKDAGTEHTFGIRTSLVDFGTLNWKFCSSIGVMGDLIATASEDDLSISWTDDDYQTYSTARTLTMDKYNRLHACGSFKRRAFEIEHAQDGPCRLEAIDYEGSVGNA